MKCGSELVCPTCRPTPPQASPEEATTSTSRDTDKMVQEGLQAWAEAQEVNFEDL